MGKESAKRGRYILGLHEDVFVLLAMILVVGGLGAFATGVSLADLRVLFISDKALYWAATTFLSALIAFILLRSRRRALEERQTLQAFLDGAGDGIIAIDRSFVITLWNPAAERITGYAAAQAVGKPLRDVVKFHRERDREESVVFVEEAMLYAERKTMPENMYLVHRDGREVPVADSAAPLLDGAGTVRGCIILFRDVSDEHKRMQLHSEFAYATHQLRTPVTKALWSLEAALGKNPPEREGVQSAYQALQSLRRMVSKVVEVTTLDQGTVRIRAEAVSVAAAVREVLEHVRKEIGLPMPDVRSDGIAESVTVQADPMLFRSILTELLENAVCYGKAGGSVTVTAEQNQDALVISIADDGLGIREQEQESVFTKFFRGSNFESSRCPGAGLGLYISRGYAELMGGKVWFTSAEGKGTTFSVSLPASRRS